MSSDRYHIGFGQYLLGYFGFMLAVVGPSIVLERLFHIDGMRSIFVGCGALFLLSSTGWPSFCYQVIRNTGWFAAISNRTVMRVLLAALGIGLVALGLFARHVPK